MPDLNQSSQTTTTTTPAWYTNSMSNLAQSGTTAGADAIANATGVNSAWNPSALQNQAFTNVQSNVGNYQPGLTQAGDYYNQAGGVNITGAVNPYLTAGTTTSGLSAANPYLTSGTSSAADLVGGYMNPYTQNVVDQIRMANQQNIQQNLSPGITAGAVGGGQFGSQRGANALALGISNANIGALGEQSRALQTGYAQALAAAQQQRSNQMQAGQTAGTLQNQFNTNQVTAGQIAGNAADQQASNLRNVGTAQAALAEQTQRQGLADVNALATMGGQQQTIAQNRVMAPLDILNRRASILSGANIPTSTTTTFDPSTLSSIASLVSTGAGIYSRPITGRNADGTPIYGESLYNTIRAQLGLGSLPAGASATQTATNTFQAADGNYYPSQAAADAATTAYLGSASNGGDAAAGGGGGNQSSSGYTDASGNALIPDGSGGFTDTDGNEYDSNGVPL